MDGWLRLGTELDTKDFDAQIAKLEDDLDTLEKEYNAISKAKPYDKQKEDLLDLGNKIEKTRNKLKSLRKEQAKQDGKIFANMNSELSKTVKSISKWALALFGIRSAYSGIRSAMSTLSQYDKTLASDIDYIKYVLANVMKPVVQWLINATYTLLSYVNYLAKAWFKVSGSIFKSSKDFKNVNKGAKDLQKTMSSFDEMNVIGDSSGGAGGGTPSFDLGSPEDIPIPSWLKWIADNGEIVVGILAGIATGLTLIKLGLDPLISLGIGTMLEGIIIIIGGIIDYLNDPSWGNFGKIIQGIGVFIVGLAIAIGSVPLAIAGACVLIIGTIIKYWDEIKGFFQGIIDWLTGKSDWVHQMFGDTIGGIYDFIMQQLQGILDGFDLIFKGIKTIFDGLIQFITGVFTGDWKKAWEGVKTIFIGVFKVLEGIVVTVVSKILLVVGTIAKTVGAVISGAFKAVVNGVMGAIETILNAPIKAVNGLIKVINKVPGIELSTLSTFKLPRLAKGGIVNQPGSGVMIGGAIAGERGAEGVIPLTDSQQMEILGEAIGKYININLTNITKLDNRQIAKEQKKINNQSNFATNS